MKLKTNKSTGSEPAKIAKPVKRMKVNKTLKSKKSSIKLAKKFKTPAPKSMKRKKLKSTEKNPDSSEPPIGELKKVAQKHEKSLNKLKNIDPEFYQYLEQNDAKLLKFNADDEFEDSDEENDVDELVEQNDGEEKEEDDKIHKPQTELEVASDESDFEDEPDDVDESNVVTLKLLKKWQQELDGEQIHVTTLKNVMDAFNSALLSIAGDKSNTALWQVDGSSAFNGVIQLCVLHLHPAIKRFLGLQNRTKKLPHKCKKWNKIRASLRAYFVDLTKVLEHISSANILIVLLKHLHQISSMIASFSNLTKPILKRLVFLWSTADETVRILAFLCILKITRTQETLLLSTVLKAMYLSYVRNSKFVSPNTLPGINFMRRSLAEMFALDLNVSYHHVFLYIRQLAIHLRNAMTLKKKDGFKVVYNWQYINSLRIWVELLTATYNKTQLHPLIFPLVNIIIGTIKLIPTAQYFPLRFHCIQMLIQLSKETRIFIPIVPFILEVLKSNTFNKKHSKLSMKPLPFTCILRLNKGQLSENGFRDTVIEQVFSSILDYMAHESFTISYPDLVVVCMINLKHYIKHVCKNSNYSRKLKQLCDKLEENSKFVEVERDRVTFSLKDSNLIGGWEATLRNKGTPLLTFYNNWSKTHENIRKRHANNADEINDYHLPTINRKKVSKKSLNDGPVELFPSDDEYEQLPVETAAQKKKSKKQKKQKRVVELKPEEDDVEDDPTIDDTVDIVKDLDLDDW